MAKFKFQWWHFILLGVLIFVAFQPGLIPFLGAAYDLTDPATNQTFACNATKDCYNQLSITGAAAGPPALACVNNLCSFAECTDTDDERISCPGGSSIIVRECVGGLWKTISGAVCPPTECVTDNDCVTAVDKDCDNELEAVQTNCISYKCTSPESSRCSKLQTFWSTYKLWIISGILIAIGVGAFIYAGPRRLWK